MRDHEHSFMTSEVDCSEITKKSLTNISGHAARQPNNFNFNQEQHSGENLTKIEKTQP